MVLLLYNLNVVVLPRPLPGEAPDVRAKTDARHARSGSSSERNLNSTAKCRLSTLDSRRPLQPLSNNKCLLSRRVDRSRSQIKPPLACSLLCVSAHLETDPRSQPDFTSAGRTQFRAPAEISQSWVWPHALSVCDRGRSCQTLGIHMLTPNSSEKESEDVPRDLLAR